MVAPYRIDLAGGWLDQPFISRIYPGSVITLSLAPTEEFAERSGLATSTRKSLIMLERMGAAVPQDQIAAAKLLFSFDNSPGSKTMSGAQDSIGLCVKGLSRHYYEGKYWPKTIEICQDEDILLWLEKHIFLINTAPRSFNYDVLGIKNLDPAFIALLSQSSNDCWDAIMNRDLKQFAKSVSETYQYQKILFPLMHTTHSIPECMGYKLAGAGGGGYAIMVSDYCCGNKIKINRW